MSKKIVRDFAPAAVSAASLFGASQGAPKKRKTLRENHASELDQLKAQAREQGYREGLAQGRNLGYHSGREEGRQEALAEFQAAFESDLAMLRAGLQQAEYDIAQAVSDWYVQAEQELGRLAVDLTGRVLRRELETNPLAILELVRSSLHETGHPKHLLIRVNPFDSPTLSKYKAEIMRASVGLQSLEIVDDPAIRGGCVLESEHGDVDATVDTMLSLLDGEAA